MNTLTPWFQLIRLPAVFTLLADTLMAAFVVQSLRPEVPTAGLVAAGIGAVFAYLAGMILNDVHDYPEDCVLRPERVLPSGKISLADAKRAGYVCLILGLAGFGIAATRMPENGAFVFLPALFLTLCILAYNTRLKETFCGPFLMGACRGFQIQAILGFTAGMKVSLGLVPLAIATYITGLTFFARGETHAAKRPGPFAMLLSVLLMTAGVGMLYPLVEGMPAEQVVVLLAAEPWRWTMLIVFLAVMVFFRGIAATFAGPVAVRQMVKRSLFNLFFLDAAITFALCGLPCACVILALMIPASLAGRSISAT
ncbi:MAG: UbiA family prenyltransferase [Planctomycetia bacterium]|nr:UbiA family prenyltransferase [Planctomycetia bacterium]